MEAGITIMNEVGVDPGIDHMLAMQCFDEVQQAGGKVCKRNFYSFFYFVFSEVFAKLQPMSFFKVIFYLLTALSRLMRRNQRKIVSFVNK